MRNFHIAIFYPHLDSPLTIIAIIGYKYTGHLSKNL